MMLPATINSCLTAAVKHPSVEYQLHEDETQAPTMAPDRLFYVTRAAFELRKSNAD